MVPRGDVHDEEDRVALRPRLDHEDRGVVGSLRLIDLTERSLEVPSEPSAQRQQPARGLVEAPVRALRGPDPVAEPTHRVGEAQRRGLGGQRVGREELGALDEGDDARGAEKRELQEEEPLGGEGEAGLQGEAEG